MLKFGDGICTFLFFFLDKCLSNTQYLGLFLFFFYISLRIISLLLLVVNETSADGMVGFSCLHIA